MSPDLDASLTAWVLADFDLTVVERRQLDGGWDPDATVWWARGHDGREWAVKWTRRDTRYGLRLMRSLAEAGTVGVPAPLLSGRIPWSERLGGRLSLTEWISGDDAFDTGLDTAGWQAFGRLLRRIHEHGPVTSDDKDPGPDAADIIGPRAETARRGIRRSGIHVRRRLSEIDALVSALPDHADPRLTLFARQWPAARARIERLRETARTLRSTREPTNRVSCHGDPHLGNVVLDADGRPWLIDFDDAVRAPREVDLMLVELGVLFSVVISDSDREAFRLGYGPYRVDEDRLVRFGCVRAVEDLVETAHELLTHKSRATVDELVDLFDGILSDDGLAGLVESRLRSSADEARRLDLA
ncbi:aminoglycoside phosphotransferase family protein [Frondihabitans sp. VKM Ac-2883]|uniref:aminoglycoside phosphotransferase family protein n=1 Tax=Frondihabitans sp. VKM Ac-2883 TaxID=2783823 RepID=UPI00188CE09D|nr:aminoglycoside phosphotransferase family protein [Frondihabitans sp. VKM Ac-2883]MBF4576996.1 aminoglycoside phosphotransferase family protein [Frondihabitans sp. VKM Ac-2883]